MIAIYLDLFKYKTLGALRSKKWKKGINQSTGAALFVFDSNFRLSYYPHRLKDFSQMLKKIFGSGAKHEVYADFKTLQEEPNPGFFVHVIHKEAATLAH